MSVVKPAARPDRLARLTAGACYVIVAAWSALNAWNHRDAMNPDGISYLDLAQETLRQGPRALVNAHWGPLYPALIALGEVIVRPSWSQEFFFVHILNAVVYGLTSVAFGFFLSELWRARQGEISGAWRAIFIFFGFSLFLCYSNADGLPALVTPDILLSGIAFAAAALFVRTVSRPTHASSVALGGILALGYYTKSVMLPAGCVLVCLLAMYGWRDRISRRNLAVTAGTMLLLCLPQICAVSARVGHFSIGETGRLNYLWWVQDVRPFAGWIGGGDSAQPQHSPRLLSSAPEVLEFGAPIAGTYPLWYDPAYWHAGAQVRFDAREQLAVFGKNLQFYKTIFAELQWPLIGLGVLTVAAIYRRHKPWPIAIWFLVWPAALLLTYCSLLNEFRYVAPWILLSFVAAYSALIIPGRKFDTVLLLAVALSALVLRLNGLIAISRIFTPTRPDSEDICLVRDLRRLGIERGDPIAIVGYGFEHYYAHLGGFRIVSQITDAPVFWALPDDGAQEVERVVAHTGAKVLIGPLRPSTFQPERWSIGVETGCGILRLQADTR